MNPFLCITQLPDFSLIKPSDLTPAIDSLLDENRKKIKELINQSEYTFENFVEPLEEIEEKLSIVWDTASHLHSVSMNVWRDVYQENLPKVINYATELSQSEELYAAFKSVSESKAFASLTLEKQVLIRHALRDFKLSGVHLTLNEKARYAELQQSLGKLSTEFEENLVDSTQAWHYYTENVSELEGLPPHAIQFAKEEAERKGKAGWWLGLDYPCYSNVMMYATHRSLRQRFYEAYVTRASDQGPCAGQHDNAPLMESILKERHALAVLLGFSDYAELSLETKMLKKSEEVLNFLQGLASEVKEKAKTQWRALNEVAGYELQPWDVSYEREQYQAKHYHITEEEVRRHFPVEKVISGLFTIVNKLYSVDIDIYPTSVWHQFVTCYVIKRAGNPIGYFYFDLYARPEKREGAWAAEAKSRFMGSHFQQLPVAYLNCNFDPPTKEGSSFLTHEQVITLFHEFGHGLQNLLTTINYPSVAGTKGIAWDVVEVASQHFENWCWEKEAIHYIADNLPDELLNKMLAARHFCGAIDLIRQIEFSLFDFALHTTYPVEVLAVFRKIHEEYGVLPLPEYNRFPNGFSHIFEGGYAAAYYSYLWAEVLSSDIFSRFKKEGIFNTSLAQAYLDKFLSQGGVPEPMAAFKAFMGREPKLEAFLKERDVIS